MAACVYPSLSIGEITNELLANELSLWIKSSTNDIPLVGQNNLPDIKHKIGTSLSESDNQKIIAQNYFMENLILLGTLRSARMKSREEG